MSIRSCRTSTSGRKGKGGFDSGIEQVIAAVLVSPEFLYRGIRDAGAHAHGRCGAFPLNDLELASRLSFFLWSQGPDEALLEVAAAGKLQDPASLAAQALRMLKDPRASSLVRNFALKWLDLDNLDEAEPDPNLFPTFNDQLRQDLAAEIESFVASVLLEDRNVGDLLTADHTFLNERLAKHYGITSVLGPQFRRVTLDDSRRWGLLGKGAVLLRTSYGNRTSPVLRGAWVMGKLMGTPPTPPPPDVDTDLSTPKGEAPEDAAGAARKPPRKAGLPSVPRRDRSDRSRAGELRRHRPLARQRRRSRTRRSTRRRCCPTGKPSTARPNCARRYSAAGDLFVRALTEKLMMYALGRDSSSTTCHKYARWCAGRRRRITGCRPSSPAS